MLNHSLMQPMLGVWKTIEQPAWFPQKQYSIIQVKTSTKIILNLKSFWSSCITRNKKGNAYIGNMLTVAADFGNLWHILLDFCKIKDQLFMKYSIQRLFNIFRL